VRGPDERESTCGTKGSSKEEEAVRSLSTNIEILSLYGLIAVEGTLLLFVGKLVTTLFLEFPEGSASWYHPQETFVYKLLFHFNSTLAGLLTLLTTQKKGLMRL
jgi:hypothetical protein